MKLLFGILLCFGTVLTYSQKINSQFELHIHKTTEPVVIDGAMNDAAWQQAETAGSFYMVLPMDTSRARVNTEVKMTYDKENLYIIAICHLPKEKTP